MRALLALTASLLAAAATGTAAAAHGTAVTPAAVPACQIYTRAGEDAPAMVRAWLARSRDDQVRVCQAAGPNGEPVAMSFTGESAVRRRGGVCSYTSHRLEKIGAAGAARLERYERGEVQFMALAGSECPTPHPNGADTFVATYDVSPRSFEAIMQLWAAAAASTQHFDQELGCCAETTSGTAVALGPVALGDSGRRLRGAIDAGHMQAARVTRIVRMSGSLLQHRYALFVANPDTSGAQSRLYVIYLRKPLRGPYHITAIADTN